MSCKHLSESNVATLIVEFFGTEYANLISHESKDTVASVYAASGRCTQCHAVLNVDELKDLLAAYPNPFWVVDGGWLEYVLNNLAGTPEREEALLKALNVRRATRQIFNPEAS